MVRKGLLFCGILSSLLYVAMNLVVPIGWEGDSSASRTVSELSVVLLGVPYTLLVTAFGCGIWASARGNRTLRMVGGVMVAYGVIGLPWPPMHLRGVLAEGGATMTHTLQIAFTIATVLLMLLAVGFGAAAFGKHFRLYSIATMVLLAACGAITGVDAPRVQGNLPTPWAGVWERINIGLFLLWVIVLATILLRTRDMATSNASAGSDGSTVVGGRNRSAA